MNNDEWQRRLSSNANDDNAPFFSRNKLKYFMFETKNVSFIE